MLGTSKNAALVIFCVVFLSEKVTQLQGLGYSIALGGLTWYQHIKITAKTPTEKPLASSKQIKEATLLGTLSASPRSLSTEANLFDRGYSMKR